MVGFFFFSDKWWKRFSDDQKWLPVSCLSNSEAANQLIFQTKHKAKAPQPSTRPPSNTASFVSCSHRFGNPAGSIKPLRLRSQDRFFFPSFFFIIIFYSHISSASDARPNLRLAFRATSPLPLPPSILCRQLARSSPSRD